jgi:glutathione synthase/RimK-type ligase-like ATP-grasp enzyme
MTMPVQFLGIYREKRFSPGAHAAGDAEILELTQAAIARLGYQTRLLAPERLPTMAPSAPVVFSMCQSLEALAVLQEWEKQGILVLNTPTAVRACYRLALVTTISQTTLPFPRSVVVPLDETASPETHRPALPESTGGWWVKRGDVHAVQSDDVLFIRHATDLPVQLVRLRQRGIGHAIVQEHIAGQEWKFYAIRGHGVLHAFAPHEAHCPPIDYVRLNMLARQAGEVLGLDIYGGDCLLTSGGTLYLIDINDWPSFRGCRPVAATHIAQQILTRAQQRGLL